MNRPIHIEPWLTPEEQSYCGCGGACWDVGQLIELAKDLPVQEMSMSALHLFPGPWDADGYREIARHIKAVLAADLNYPIILDADGRVMDGRHRIMKALIEGRESIKFVRFDKTPEPRQEPHD